MTDARLPGRWLLNPVMEELSDRAWRSFTGSLMWSAEQGTDGSLTGRAMRLLHPEGVSNAVTRELVDAGLWQQDERGALSIANWTETQSTSEQLAQGREQARIRKQRQRDRARLQAVTRDGQRDGQRDDTGDVTRVSPRQGEASARRGQAEEDLSPNPARLTPHWPVAKIPGPGNLADIDQPGELIGEPF